MHVTYVLITDAGVIKCCRCEENQTTPKKWPTQDLLAGL